MAVVAEERQRQGMESVGIPSMVGPEEAAAQIRRLVQPGGLPYSVVLVVQEQQMLPQERLEPNRGAVAVDQKTQTLGQAAMGRPLLLVFKRKQ